PPATAAVAGIASIRAMPARAPRTGMTRGEPASFARRVPSREGLGTLPGFPSSFRTAGDDHVRRRNLHRLVRLVVRGQLDLHDPDVGPRLGGTQLDHLALYAQHVARAHGGRPGQ